jgi:phosphate transport system substrate-binding protein
MKKAFSLLLVSVLAASSLQAEKVVIKGSDTLGAKLVPQMAENFKASNPGVSFEIAAEGSTTGIAAIIDGTADIGMSSRRAKATEMSSALAKGVQMKPTIVAYDAIGVVVNKNNPIEALSKDQVEKIFTGEVTDWSAVGGSPGKISIYTRNTSSGTYSDFKELAMKKKDYAGSSQKMAGNEQIAAEVGKNANGIGYVGLAYITAPGLKVVPIGGVSPTVASVHAKTYPYSRPTFFYTNGTPEGSAKKFYDYVLSPAGQAIVTKVGFVPIAEGN